MSFGGLPEDADEQRPDDGAPSGSWVGRTVQNAGKPEWGSGKVLSVHPAQFEGRPAQRVTVQFPTVGTRSMLVPPAQLTAPGAAVERAQGWLDQLAGVTMDDRLRRLPESAAQVLGTLTQRIAAVLPWYAFSDAPADLDKWARKLVGVGDPLTQWSRDELTAAFAAFCSDRDAHLRGLVAQLLIREGVEAPRQWVDGLAEPVRERVRSALSRVI